MHLQAQVKVTVKVQVHAHIHAGIITDTGRFTLRCRYKYRYRDNTVHTRSKPCALLNVSDMSFFVHLIKHKIKRLYQNIHEE